MIYFSEESLTNLVKHSNAISPTTQHYSTERQGIEGVPPRGSNSARLISCNIKGNSVLFTFLAGATEKYPVGYQYKDTNKDTLGLERNPSKTYTIYFQFDGLDKLTRLSKSRVSKKKFDPNKPSQYKGSISNITIEEIKAFIKSTNVKIFDSSPAFQYQGQNYNLGQLGSSLYPTDIPPKKPHRDERGNFHMGWEDIHKGSFLTKHLNDIFKALPWYINQMSGMLLRKIRTPEAPTKMPPMPAPKAPPSSATRPPTQSAPPAPPEADQTMIQNPPQVNTFGKPIEPQVDIKQRTQMDQAKQPNQPIQASPEPQYPGNPDQNPNNYDPNELQKEQIMWKKTPYGYEFTQEVATKGYTTKLITEVKHTENNILLLDESVEDFIYSFDKPMPFKERYNLYRKLHDLEEVCIFLEEGNEEERTPGIIEEVMDFLKDCPYDIVTFESTLEKPGHAKMVKTIAETMELVFPSYSKTILTHENTSDFSIYLVKEKQNLQEADGENEPLPDAPEDNQVPSNANHGGPEQGPPDQQEPQAAEPEKNELPPKSLVCAFGSFNPITKDHLELLKKVYVTAQHQKADAVVFIQADPYFSQDEVSMRIRKEVIEKLSKIHVIADTEIIDFIKAMSWAYNHRYTNIMVITGDDEIAEITDLLKVYNGKDNNEGHFLFNNFKVGSYGGNNPDKSQSSIAAVNAITANDIDSYLRAIDLPYIKALKKLFYVARYELQNKTGMTESAIPLKEIELESTIKAIISGKSQSYINAAIARNSGALGTKIHSSVDVNTPLPYAYVLQKFRAVYKSEGVDPLRDKAFKELLMYFYPEEYRTSNHSPF